MFRRLAAGLLLTIFALLGSLAPATAADDILKLTPEGASGLVVINRAGTLDAKFQALGRVMMLPVPAPLALLKLQFGVAEGFDENGTLGLLVLPPEEKQALPRTVLLVPVADYDKFVGQFKPEDAASETAEIKILNQSVCVRRLGGYAAMAELAHREILEKQLKASASVPAALAPWQAWLAEKDVGAVILHPGIARLATRVEEVLQRIQATVANGPNKEAKNIAGVFDMYAELLKTANQEVASVGFGLQLDEKSTLRLTKRVLLVPDGRWAKIASQAQPAKENLLAGLPEGPFVLAGGVPFYGETMMKPVTDMMKNMSGMYGMTPEQMDKMITLSMDLMRGMHGTSVALTVGQAGESLYSPMILVMQVDDSAAFLTQYEAQTKAYGDLLREVDNPMLPAPEIEKTTVGDVAALQLTVKASSLPEEQQTPQQAKMMRVMFGPEGKLVGWIAAANKQRVVFAYDKDRLLAAIEAIQQGKPGLAADADVAKTAALLPPNPVAVGYLSPAGAIEFAKWFVPAVSPMGAGSDLKLPAFPKTPPIGMAITTGPNEVQSCLVIPAEVFQAVGPYAMQVQAMRMAPPAGGKPAAPPLKPSGN